MSNCFAFTVVDLENVSQQVLASVFIILVFWSRKITRARLCLAHHYWALWNKIKQKSVQCQEPLQSLYFLDINAVYCVSPSHESGRQEGGAGGNCEDFLFARTQNFPKHCWWHNSCPMIICKHDSNLNWLWLRQCFPLAMNIISQMQKNFRWGLKWESFFRSQKLN